RSRRRSGCRWAARSPEPNPSPSPTPRRQTTMSDETLLNAAADGAAADLESAWFSIHDGATSGDEVSNERLQPSYGSASSGAADPSAPLSSTGTPQAAVSRLGVWTAETAGSFRFAVALSGDLAFNAEGDLDLASAEITVADAT